MNEFVEPGPLQKHIDEPVDSAANIALAVDDLHSMKKFYQEVLGFELLGEFPSAALLKVRAGCTTRVQKLGLLQRSARDESTRKQVEHVAFALPLRDPDSERQRLERLGLKVAAMNLDGIDSGLLSFRDPEGNEVELLCCRPMRDN